MPRDPVRSAGWFPIVGAMVGAVVGLSAAALIGLEVPRLAASAVALALGAVLTGAMHEDGLGDVADGFGGGMSQERKLAIMHDSRLGTYGTLALLVTFTVRVAAIAAIPADRLLPALTVAYAVSRATMVMAVSWLPLAKSDGLAATAGRPSPLVLAVTAMVASAIALLLLPWRDALLSLGASLAAALCMALLAWRQIGGQTGDVFGAAEQLGQSAVLLVLATPHR